MNTVIHNLLRSEIDKKKFFVRRFQRNILLSYRPTLSIWLKRGEFPAQRIILTFLEGDSGTEVTCEVRPFYSAFLLPAFIVIAMIVDVILPNQYISISMKIIGVVLACLIGLAIFLPFRPSTDTLNKVMKDIKFHEACGVIS